MVTTLVTARKQTASMGLVGKWTRLNRALHEGLGRMLTLDFNYSKHSTILDDVSESLGDLPFACIDSADTATIPWLTVLAFIHLATRLGSNYPSNRLLSLLPFGYRAHW